MLAPSFADLFHGNCCQNGLLPVTLPAKAVQELLGRYDAAPDGYELTVDLLTTTVRDARGFESAFDIPAYRREMLLHGLDEIGRTLQQQDAIAAFERARPVKRFALAVLPGDGIGPEVTAEALKVLHAAADLFGYRIDSSEHAVGAAGVAESGDSLPERTRAAVVEADAVLLGAVGHPDLASAEGKRRPEAGLLALRKLLGVYANLRPVVVHPSLVHASPLRPERLAGVDLLIVRELTGGLYYGEPRALERDSAVNTLRYTAAEIERVARVAFRAAAERRGLLTSVDKANVLEVSRAVARDGHAGGGGGVPGDQARAPVRGFRRHATGRGSRAGGRAADRKPVRRHPER